MVLTREALEDFYSFAETSYKEISAGDDSSVIVHYSGDLNFGFANALTSRLERLLEEKIESKRVKKRFFSVFVEAIQNIRLHGEMDDSEHVHSIVTVFVKDQKLQAKFSNIIESRQARELADRYEEINLLDPITLKERYMEIMMNGARSDKGGAGLGILTIVMRSKNPSPVSVRKLNDEYDIFTHLVSVDMN